MKLTHERFVLKLCTFGGEGSSVCFFRLELLFLREYVSCATQSPVRRTVGRSGST